MKRIICVLCCLLLCSCQMEIKGNKNEYYEKTDGLISIVDSDSRLTSNEKAVLLSDEFRKALSSSALYENKDGSKIEFSLKYHKDKIENILEHEYEAIDYFQGEQWLNSQEGFVFSISKELQGYSIQGNNLKVGYKLDKVNFEELERLFENFKLQGLLSDYDEMYDYDGVKQTSTPFLNNEADAVFRKGFTAIGLFTNGTLPMCKSTMLTEGVGAYHRTAEVRFQYFDDFKEYLSSVFSDDLVEKLLFDDEGSAIRYMNVDGYTALMYEAEHLGRIEIVEYKLIDQDKDKVSFSVIGEQVKENNEITGKEYHYVIEMINENGWRIHEFNIVDDSSASV